ncbi:DUF4116 domain-containing protein, partial [Candidatus Gracilibacteria bacterium]|nr:DUF4116 domain-containing protein [Candidatus Gracilibacteria bacterium]
DSCHYNCHHINGIQIKNTSKDLRTRYNQLKNGACGNKTEVSIDQETDNSFFRKEAIKLIRASPSEFENFPYEFKNDKQIVEEVIKHDGYYFQYASDELKNDKVFVLRILKLEGEYLDEYPYGFILENIGDNLRKDEDFLLEVLNAPKGTVGGRKEVFQYISDKYKKNKSFILDLIKKGHITLDEIDDVFLNDRDIVLEYVKKDQVLWSSDKLGNISKVLKDDIEIFTYVSKSLNPGHIKYASERIRDDGSLAQNTLIHGGVNKSSCVLQVLSSRLRDNKSLIISFIEKDPISFQYASSVLRGDKELAIIAIEKDWRNIEYISEKLKDDAEILLKASYQETKKIGSTLCYEGYNFNNAVKHMSKKFNKMTYDDVKALCWKPEDSYAGLALFVYKIFH